MAYNTIAVIPARLESSRLAKKVLLKESGKYLIQHVYEQVCKSKLVSKVIIATDRQEIVEACLEFKAPVVLTSTHHQSGTDRIAEAVKGMKFDYVINVQGDEPLIPPEYIDKLIELIQSNEADFATLGCPLKSLEELENPNVVKVYVDRYEEACDFSRRSDFVLGNGYFILRHIGMYAYSNKGLKTFTKLDHSEREKNEKLEQLRLLNYGYTMLVGSVPGVTVGVDTREDYDRFLKLLAERQP